MEKLQDQSDVYKKIKQLQKKSFNLDRMKHDLLDWLAQFNFPAYQNASCWEDCIKEFPSGVEETDTSNTGIRIRLAIRLFTKENQYLISIMECLDPEAERINIITTHVNWKHNEWRTQQILEQSYSNGFKDMLKAKHTLWAQTFYNNELHEALNSCAIAILGNELTGGIKDKNKKEILKNPQPVKAIFPKQADE